MYYKLDLQGLSMVKILIKIVRNVNKMCTETQSNRALLSTSLHLHGDAGGESKIRGQISFDRRQECYNSLLILSHQRPKKC